ncbi:MAG: hypothetical protein RLQ73_02550 [Hoeflea sp. D1-CHI-28]
MRSGKQSVSEPVWRIEPLPQMVDLLHVLRNVESHQAGVGIDPGVDFIKLGKGVCKEPELDIWIQKIEFTPNRFHDTHNSVIGILPCCGDKRFRQIVDNFGQVEISGVWSLNEWSGRE